VLSLTWTASFSQAALKGSHQISSATVFGCLVITNVLVGLIE